MIARVWEVTMPEDDQSHRDKPPPSLLRYEAQYANRSTTHHRSKAKLMGITVRGSLVARVDIGAEIVCMKLMVAQLTRGEFESWIGLKEGVLFDPLPKRTLGVVHRNWWVVPPPAKVATPEALAKHYQRSEQTVLRYDREARRVLQRIREAAGLIGDAARVPIWPAVMNDENLLRYLFTQGE